MSLLDVGQGDCVVLIAPERRAIVIDTGSSYIGNRILVPFLHNKGINKVDLLLLSHGDFDHAGGSVSLVRNMPIKKIILATDNLSEYQENMVRLAESNVIVQAAQGLTCNVVGVEVKILDVPEKMYCRN